MQRMARVRRLDPPKAGAWSSTISRCVLRKYSRLGSNVPWQSRIDGHDGVVSRAQPLLGSYERLRRAPDAYWRDRRSVRSFDADERRFLLETSILDELEVDIRAAVTPCSDAAGLLRSFASRGLFTRASCASARADHERGAALVEESPERAKAGDDAALVRASRDRIRRRRLAFRRPADTVIDVREIERAIEAARAAEARGAVEEAYAAVLQAVTTYRGDFLEGAEDAAWLWRERERLRKPYLAALRWLVRHPGDDMERSIELLDRLLDETPFDVEAVKRRLDVMTKELRAPEAAQEYARRSAPKRPRSGSLPIRTRC